MTGSGVTVREYRGGCKNKKGTLNDVISSFDEKGMLSTLRDNAFPFAGGGKKVDRRREESMKKSRMRNWDFKDVRNGAIVFCRSLNALEMVATNSTDMYGKLRGGRRRGVGSAVPDCGSSSM